MLRLHKQLERCARIPGYLSIRAGMGLGDSLYLQSVARHFVSKGQKVLACSKWPDVFRPLGDSVIVGPFTRLGVDKVAHYSLRKGVQGTTQFQDCCIQAGIKEPVALRLDWAVTELELVETVSGMAKGLPIVCVQLPRPPMDRKDGFGKELMPNCAVIQRQIDRLKGKAFLVQIGAGQSIHKFDGLDLDLANKTTVAQLLDLASVAHGFIGYVSFIVPMAESLRKPALIVWSSRGLRGTHPYIQQIKPSKVLNGNWCKWAMDDWEPNRIDEAFNGFL